MRRKQIIFIADSLDNAHAFQAVLSTLPVEVAAGSSAQLDRLLKQYPACDLVVFEVCRKGPDILVSVESALLEAGCGAFLVIARGEQLATLNLPCSLPSDFVVPGASVEECSARIRQLLWPLVKDAQTDQLVIDALTINLATYQVKVGGQPLDLTYLEYALLAFLATHPLRTYSRDALLHHVWGLDYYGGSRTVDVHVRRIRAKLGPELAQRLETVRGVGYLWSTEVSSGFVR